MVSIFRVNGTECKGQAEAVRCMHALGVGTYSARQLLSHLMPHQTANAKAVNGASVTVHRLSDATC